MRAFGKNRLLESLKLMGKIIGVVLLMALVVVSVRAAWGMYQKFAAASEARHVAESELGTLKDKKNDIEAAVAVLSSERGVEAEIRHRFGVARAGEGEIRIVREENDKTGREGEPQGLWSWIVETFFVW